jgi:hypothetical protein
LADESSAVTTAAQPQATTEATAACTPSLPAPGEAWERVHLGGRRAHQVAVVLAVREDEVRYEWKDGRRDRGPLWWFRSRFQPWDGQ